MEKTTQNLLKRLKQKDKELKEYEKRLKSVAESQPDAFESERKNFLREKREWETACVKAVNDKEAAELQTKVCGVLVDIQVVTHQFVSMSGVTGTLVVAVVVFELCPYIRLCVFYVGFV